jgi:hypothetical protein
VSPSRKLRITTNSNAERYYWQDASPPGQVRPLNSRNTTSWPRRPGRSRESATRAAALNAELESPVDMGPRLQKDPVRNVRGPTVVLASASVA